MARLLKEMKSKKSKPTSASSFALAIVLTSIGLVVACQLFLVRQHSSISSVLIDNPNPRLEDSKKAVSISKTTTTTAKREGMPKVLAIVFPQYHSDPINDRLWGEGFTDWDNLKAAPTHNRLGLEIPRPTELGYYDLRNRTVRKMQGDLAKEYEIDGFVYHHYWFYDPNSPGPNLHAPLMEMLKDGQPDVPFFFNWCDSSWADTWLGKTKDGTSTGQGDQELQKQYFPDESDPEAIQKHYDWLKQFFHHPNYIKVEGQPVFMIYERKPGSYPLLKRLRRLAQEDGFPGLYFAQGMSFTHAELFPEGKDLGQRRHRYAKYLANTTVAYPFPLDFMEGKVLQVPEWCRQQSNPVPPKGLLPEIPGILTSFDNTPRRDLESAHLWSPDSPDIVVQRLHESLSAALYYQMCCLGGVKEDSFILINSMNEWAEGMSLEPSTVFGRRLLEAVKRAKHDVHCYPGHTG